MNMVKESLQKHLAGLIRAFHGENNPVLLHRDVSVSVEEIGYCIAGQRYCGGDSGTHNVAPLFSVAGVTGELKPRQNAVLLEKNRPEIMR